MVQDSGWKMCSQRVEEGKDAHVESGQGRAGQGRQKPVHKACEPELSPREPCSKREN